MPCTTKIHNDPLSFQYRAGDQANWTGFAQSINMIQKTLLLKHPEAFEIKGFKPLRGESIANYFPDKKTEALVFK
ncbi:MAG: hypothetical protein R2788_22620 [Saprospiraceae bacterium]